MNIEGKEDKKTRIWQARIKKRRRLQGTVAPQHHHHWTIADAQTLQRLHLHQIYHAQTLRSHTISPLHLSHPASPPQTPRPLPLLTLTYTCLTPRAASVMVNNFFFPPPRRYLPFGGSTWARGSPSCSITNSGETLPLDQMALAQSISWSFHVRFGGLRRSDLWCVHPPLRVRSCLMQHTLHIFLFLIILTLQYVCPKYEYEAIHIACM